MSSAPPALLAPGLDVRRRLPQQRSIARNPHLKLKAFGIDSGGVRARHVIERMIKAQQPAAANEASDPG